MIYNSHLDLHILRFHRSYFLNGNILAIKAPENYTPHDHLIHSDNLLNHRCITSSASSDPLSSNHEINFNVQDFDLGIVEGEDGTTSYIFKLLTH